MNKTMLSILKVLDAAPDAIIGSREISRQLTRYGVDLTERTVRYHLRILDEKGYTRVFGKEGRSITPKGREELSQSMVTEKVGFIISKIENLAFLSDFDLAGGTGKVILNVTFFHKKVMGDALEVMKSVFASRYNMSTRVARCAAGECIGDVRVPEDHVGFGTVCSVTLNSILLKAGIPVTSKFGGVLQIENGEPSRFTSLISYAGSSLDPLEIYIKSGMTDVRSATTGGTGQILASFREIPIVCLEKMHGLQEDMLREGIGGILLLGNPNQDLLDVPVGIDKAGIVVVGGLNPAAAVEEAGIPTRSRAMSTLFEYSRLVTFDKLLRGEP